MYSNQSIGGDFGNERLDTVSRTYRKTTKECLYGKATRK